MVLLRRRCFLMSCFIAADPWRVNGSELKLGDAPYSYAVLDQDLRIALREFGAHVGLRVTVSDAVSGRIRGRLPPLPPREFLDRLAAQFGFDWYFDGYALHVTATSEGVTTILSQPGLAFDALVADLRAVGVYDARFPLRPHTESGYFLVAGPPRYVDLVEKAAGVLAKRDDPAPMPPAVQANGAAPTSTMTVYRGKEVRRTVLDHAGRPVP